MQISDNDLEELEATDPRSQLAMAHSPARAPLPLYDLSLAQAPPAQNGTPGLLTRKIGPLPVWGWGLIAAGLGGVGYVWYRSKKAAPVKANDAEDTARSDDDEDERPAGGWSPSRSRFGDQLNRHLTRKGLAGRCRVYTDADEADKAGLKAVSPLITIKVTGAKVKVDKDLDRLCKRDGLTPTEHEDGSIGLYPTSSKRGREWEKYIDALRDDGQQR